MSTIKTANVIGHDSMPMNIWGHATLLLGLLEREGHLPNCSIYFREEFDGSGDYYINTIKVGRTSEEVTTAIWLMVESYHTEGHIDYQDNATMAEAAIEVGAV